MEHDVRLRASTLADLNLLKAWDAKHPVEAVLHCYRAAVSQYRTAVVQHRHQGLLTGAGAPPNEALHSAAVLLPAVAVRVGHGGLHPAAVVSRQCMGMALHPAPARPLLGTGTGASHPNGSCSMD
jgi:hypothetical protein